MTHHEEEDRPAGGGKRPAGEFIDRIGAYAEVDDEIRQHIAERADDLIERGWKRDDANVEAERRFGSVPRIRKKMARENSSGRGRPPTFGQGTVRNLKFAWRGIKTSPGITAAVVLTLGLGLGAISSVFVVLDAALLRPLPYRDADRLVELGSMPSRVALRWRESSQSFADGWVAFVRPQMVRIDGPSAHNISVVGVTPGADTLLGIGLLSGRSFTSEDAQPGAPPVAVMSRELFERSGADPAMIGRTIRLDAGPVTVVGVFRDRAQIPQYGGAADLWLPMRTDFTVADRDGGGVQGVWVRLKQGISLELAQERAEAIAASLQAEDPLERGWRVQLRPIARTRQQEDIKQALWLLTATAGSIFLIALVNGVNLLLVRTSARTRELAVRTALGGSRRQLLAQFLSEGLILGVLGGVAAVGLTLAVIPLLQGVLPSRVAFLTPHAFEVQGRVLVLIFLGAVCAGLVFGCLPAFHSAARRHPFRSLMGRSGDQTPTHRWVRNTLVVAQVSLSMTLLTGSGLFLRSFVRLVNVNPGFDVERLAVAQFWLSATLFPTAADRRAFVDQLSDALEAHPGIHGVTASEGLIFRMEKDLQAEGRAPPDGQPSWIPEKSVAIDFTEVMGIDLSAGRGFRPEDLDQDVAIIDQDLASFLWGSSNAIDQRFRIGEAGNWYTVVGVAEELRLMGRDQRSGPSQVLLPARRDEAGPWQEIAIRASGDPRELLSVVREITSRVAPDQPIAELRSAADALSAEDDGPRFLVAVSSLFAIIAVTLAAIGIYGVLAFSVRQRRREIGVRMALGAERAQLRIRVIAEGLRITGLGLLLGLLGTFATARFIRPLLYEIPALDPATLAGMMVLFGAISMVACLVPAERASRVDPVVVLKEE